LYEFKWKISVITSRKKNVIRIKIFHLLLWNHSFYKSNETKIENKNTNKWVKEFDLMMITRMSHWKKTMKKCKPLLKKRKFAKGFIPDHLLGMLVCCFALRCQIKRLNKTDPEEL
jgi:hypothetical protein